MIRARLLTAGKAEGPVLSLDEPLSFWGAFEPRTGVIIDVHHPQRGACVKGTILLMTRDARLGLGAGCDRRGDPARHGAGGHHPGRADINLAVGAEVAATLYGRALRDRLRHRR